MPKEKLYGKYIDEFVQNILDFTQTEKINYDLLHGHYADGWETVRKYWLKTNIPYVLPPHSLGRNKKRDCLERLEGSEEELDEKYNFAVRIKSEEASLKNCTKLFTLSSFEKKFALEHYRALKCRLDDIYPIPNGIDLSLFSESVSEKEKIRLRQKIGVRLNEFMILIPSRIDARKGQLNAVKALGKVGLKIRKKVKLVLLCWPNVVVGGYLQRVQEAIYKNHQERSVITLPPVPRDQILKYLKTANVTLLPSQEYFSMAMIESMYAGTPVIASKFSGAVDAIESGKSGILINHNDIDEICVVINKVYKMSKEERSLMGKLAKKKVEKYYTWTAVAKKMHQQYLKILS